MIGQNRLTLGALVSVLENKALDAGVEGCASPVNRGEGADIRVATKGTHRWLELRLRNVGCPPAAEVAIAWVRRILDLVAHANLD